MNSNKPPFHKSVVQLVDTFGISPDDAMQRVQNGYRLFKSRNDRLLERQNDAVNRASSNLNNQVTLIATASLAFSGAFVGSVHGSLEQSHIILFIVIAILELLATTMTVVDYVMTVGFHKKWAEMYMGISNDVDEAINSGEMQETSQMATIERG